MTIMRRIRNGLARVIYVTALALVLYFLCEAIVGAGAGHRGVAILELPLRLSPRGRNVFYALWMFYWLSFWRRMGRFSRDSRPARKVLINSWALVIVGTGLWCWLSQAKPGFFQRLAHFSGVEGIGMVLLKLLGLSFPIVFLGAILLVIADLLGLSYADPLEEELRQKVRWERQVKHQKYLQEAARDWTTYVGYETTFNRPVYLTPKERNEHVHIVGTTGSGKTRFVIFPMMRQDIQQGRGVLFVDAKGSLENAKALCQMASEAGRKKDLLLFSLSPGYSSATYNPLRWGNSTQLQDKISATIEWSEPYYQRVCEDVLQSLFMDLQERRRRVTLNDLHEIFRNPPSGLPTFRELAIRHQKETQTLRSEVGLLVNADFGKLFDRVDADIDLLKAYRKRKIVYFGLDTQSYPRAARRVGKLITQDINTLSGMLECEPGERSRKPLAVYIDEFQAFGTKEFINALARGRSSGLWITLAHQSLGDLKAIDEAYAQQVNDNTNTKIFLRVNDPETAQSFSDFVGTGKTIETTRHIHLQGAAPANIMGSQKVVHQYLIHPTELKNLETGQAMFKSGSRHGRLLLNSFLEDNRSVKLPKRRPSKENVKLELPFQQKERIVSVQ
jgi:conjugal transfer pilus assembly protein TraD